MGCVFFYTSFSQRSGVGCDKFFAFKKNTKKTRTQKTGLRRKEKKTGRKGDALVSDAEIRLF